MRITLHAAKKHVNFLEGEGSEDKKCSLGRKTALVEIALMVLRKTYVHLTKSYSVTTRAKG